MSFQLPTLSEWIAMLAGLYGGWGYPLVAAAAALENTFLVSFVFPGGTMVLLGGVYARLGTLELPFVVLAGWLGTFVGASGDYALGRFGGRGALGRLLAQPNVAPHLDRAGVMLRRYGLLALLGGHFIPQVRTLVAVAAGITRMPYPRFALYEAPAALLWSSVYAVGGYLLAEQIPLFDDLLRRFGWFLLALFIAIVVVRLVRGRRRGQPGV